MLQDWVLHLCEGHGDSTETTMSRAQKPFK